MIITYSIGYYTPDDGGRMVSYPYIATTKVFRQFSDDVREPDFIKFLFEFAEKYYFRPSSMALYVNINNDHFFIIRMINVREYKMVYDKWMEERKANREKLELENI